MDSVHCDELRRVALDARRDEASFLAARTTPCLLVIGKDRSDLSEAVVVPLGALPAILMLGRHPENDSVAPWPSISRRHAMRLVAEDAAYLLDRGSANGTFIGKERLLPDAPHPLKDGDELVLGSELHAIFLSSRGLLEVVKRITPAA